MFFVILRRQTAEEKEAAERQVKNKLLFKLKNSGGDSEDMNVSSQLATPNLVMNFYEKFGTPYNPLKKLIMMDDSLKMEEQVRGSHKTL